MPDGALSPSSLAFLFANRFVLAAKPGTTGTRSFATGVTVNTRVLAVHLPLIALWSLRESGYISLVPFEEKRLRGVRAVLTQPGATSGIEGQIIDRLARSRDGSDTGETVYNLIRRLIPISALPFEAVIRVALDDVADKGYVTRVSHKVGALGRLKHESKWTYEPNPPCYPALADEVEAVAAGWKVFLHDDVYESVSDSSLAAIEARTKDDSFLREIAEDSF